MPQRRATDNLIIVQEIDDFIAKNTLTPLEKLNLRVTKHNYINGLSASKHVENQELHTAKGIFLKGKVIGWAAGILFGGYLFLRVIETVSGLDKLLLLLVR